MMRYVVNGIRKVKMMGHTKINLQLYSRLETFRVAGIGMLEAGISALSHLA